MVKKAIALLMSLIMIFPLCACGSTTEKTISEDPAAAEETISEDSLIAAEETLMPAETGGDTASETEAETIELSETALAEQVLFSSIDYDSAYNFVTEAEFYSLLKQCLALHDAEMTLYPGDSAYYYIPYENVENVRMLTVAKTLEEIESDRAAAEDSGSAGDSAETEADNETFDPDKDVDNSTDYVTSFVMSSGTGEMDQQFLFLLSAAALCILDPHFDNTDTAFEYLWNSLYKLYGSAEGQPVSMIDGFDAEGGFTVPGNGAKLWMGTDADGNYLFAITLYVEYDEIIDIAGTSGTTFQSATY